MKAKIARTVSGLITSPRVRDARRAAHATLRRMRRAPPVVHFFHQADDPHSHLLLQVLPALLARYAIELRPWVVAQPGDTVAPDRPRLLEWSRRDAEDLAAATSLEYRDPGHQPEPDRVVRAQRALTALLVGRGPATSAMLARAFGVSQALWRGDHATADASPQATDADTAAFLDEGTGSRSKLGHYLGGTLCFEGEWYWGVDRLAHLERRLRAASLARDSRDEPVVAIPEVACRHTPGAGRRPELHFFCSLRSPYTYVAIPRVRRLAAHYCANLQLRFVLPMVMRGLPVPREKRLYILHDTTREAERLGLPFGRIVDPVGRPTERGLAVLHRAVAAGRGPDFLESFMRGVWAEGLDAGDDRDMGVLARRAGLDGSLVTDALSDESWREVASRNREEMLGLGLWGVPSFRVDDAPARWGQDRLWRIERDLISATQARPAEETNA
jgi:2-hydroxychromene-2-carboxylate isomerase